MKSRIKDLDKRIKYMTVDLTSREELERDKKQKEKNKFTFFILFMILAAFLVAAGLFALPYGWVLIVAGVFICIWGILLTFM